MQGSFRYRCCLVLFSVFLWMSCTVPRTGLGAFSKTDASVDTDSCISVEERCDGVDNDCDTRIDEGELVQRCGGESFCGQRCIDGEFAETCENTRDPSAEESCNGDDDDCDGSVDEGCPCENGATKDCGPCVADGTQTCSGGGWGECVGATPPTTFYRDRDEDGYGNLLESRSVCDEEPGWVRDNTDCFDDCSLCFPGGTEICDNLNNDCDANVDEGLPLETWYRDRDGDGYGDEDESQEACSPPSVGEWVTDNTDCDDECPLCHPDYPIEICDDGVDNDCNEQIDEGGCKCDYAEIDSGTYLVCTPAIKREAASQRCMRLGGDVVSIESEKEQTELWDLLEDYNRDFWLSGSDANEEGNWEWSDGSTFTDCVDDDPESCDCTTYCNWMSSQPNNDGADGQDCLVLDADAGEWKDVKCDRNASVVCEISAP